MYLIAKQKDGHRAIPIHPGDKWDFHKLTVGKREVRIIFRLRGRRYMLYSTIALAAKHPKIGIAQFTPLCDEIIAITTERILHGDEYIDFTRIAAAAECRHHARWRDKGLISPATPELYHGHPVDPKTETLIAYTRVKLDDIVIMDHEPPVDDSEQEELPY